MITFDECGAMLDEIADSMPYELYRDLNGGISLLPQLKVHPKALNNDLFILGEYIRNSLGNAIVFYYGSINRVYGSLDNEEYRKTHKPALNISKIKQQQKVKFRCFELFGGVCQKCGFSDIRALQIDHINGVPAGLRRMKGNPHRGGIKLCSYLLLV